MMAPSATNNNPQPTNRFRLFARLPNEVHTKICVFDPLNIPSLKTLCVAVASKLKAAPGMNYQLLVDNMAVVEHTSELRDGDTVVLQVTAPPPPVIVEEQDVRPNFETNNDNGIYIVRVNSQQQSTPDSSTGTTTTTTTNITANDSNAANQQTTNDDSPPKSDKATTKVSPQSDNTQTAANHQTNGNNERNHMIATSSGLSLTQELSKSQRKHATSDTSVDSTKSNAEVAVKAAVRAAAAELAGMPDCSDDETESEEDDTVELVSVMPTTTKTNNNRRRSKRLNNNNNKTSDSDKENAPPKRPKKVNFEGGKSNPQEQDEPAKPPPAKEAVKETPKSFEVNERYFVSHFDGNYYPVRIIGAGSSDGRRCVQYEESTIAKEFPIAELLQETEEIKSQWLYRKSSSSASVCSVSSRSTRSSAKSPARMKYGPNTNVTRAKNLHKELKKYGIENYSGRWVAERNRIVYFCKDDETPNHIKEKFPRVSIGKILYDNRILWGEKLQANSRMQPRSPFVLPRTWHGRMVVNTANTANPNMIQWKRTRNSSNDSTC